MKMNSPISTIEERASLRAAALYVPVVLLGFGLLYSVVGAVLGGSAFPHTAAGSMFEQNGKILGSELVAQPFAAPRYFQPRPSASNYDPMAAAGSNMARSNPDMRKRIADTIAAVAARDGIDPGEVPSDLATQSGSGMDPDLSPAAARVQVARVARARGLSPAQVEALVGAHIRGRQFGVLGQPRVNVLELNLALDAQSSK
jgi:K+-transporting ATPase ATPase C chain